VLKRVWALCDHAGEDEVLRLLEEYAEGHKHEREEPN
jgi:hypothetical protein